ncbi:NAD(P)H-binding protein [Burkholderia glumae]|uniref:NAD(P)H-binding protein n=1 Tax=Burkholderia glumae TaxID=337 RepID=UPI0020D115D6|nr:NAD(P)H-binding protein [Burkholderia glumae]
MAGKKTIALFGATGPTGRHIIEEALTQGYKLSVYTRDAKKLAPFAGRVEIVVGDLQDQRAIAKCVQGAAAVISALGPNSLKGRCHVSGVGSQRAQADRHVSCGRRILGDLGQFTPRREAYGKVFTIKRGTQ